LHIKSKKIDLEGKINILTQEKEFALDRVRHLE
jgi:hypothetical protein